MSKDKIIKRFELATEGINNHTRLNSFKDYIKNKTDTESGIILEITGFCINELQRLKPEEQSKVDKFINESLARAYELVWEGK